MTKLRHETHRIPGYIQCRICLEWYRALPSHLYRAHGVCAFDYKERFSIFKTEPLCAPDVSRALSGTTSDRRRRDPLMPAQMETLRAMWPTKPGGLDRLCEVCGLPFHTNRSDDRKTCGHRVCVRTIKSRAALRLWAERRA